MTSHCTCTYTRFIQHQSSRCRGCYQQYIHITSNTDGLLTMEDWMLQEEKRDHRTLRVHPSELEVPSSCAYCPHAHYRQRSLQSGYTNAKYQHYNYKSKLNQKVTFHGLFSTQLRAVLDIREGRFGPGPWAVLVHGPIWSFPK